MYLVKAKAATLSGPAPTDYINLLFSRACASA
jgi:hypothetical protein